MHLTQIAIDLLSSLGYGGLAAGLILDSFGIPIPSEVLLMLGGTLAATGRFNVVAVFVVGVAAQVVGALLGYAVGKYGGLPVLERYGKYVLISKHDLAKAHAAFEQYGPLMTMVGRCLPVVRGFISYPAGIAGMRLDKFMLYSAIGSSIWSALFISVGVTVGANLAAVEPWINQLSLLIIVLFGIAIIWHFREPLQTALHRAKAGRSQE